MTQCNNDVKDHIVLIIRILGHCREVIVPFTIRGYHCIHCVLY